MLKKNLLLIILLTTQGAFASQSQESAKLTNVVTCQSSHFCYCYINPEGAGSFLARVDFVGNQKFVTNLDYIQSGEFNKCHTFINAHPACK